MIRTDDMYGEYPTLEEIKRDYKELLGLIGSITTKEKAVDLKHKYNITVEINGEFAEQYKRTDAEINWIRYAAYGCLDNIYVYCSRGSINEIYFDVWSNECDSAFIEGISFDDLDAVYEIFERIKEVISKSR